MFKSKCPCRKCDSRHIGCHTTCSKFASWRIECEAAERKRKRENDAVGYYSDFHKAMREGRRKHHRAVQ